MFFTLTFGSNTFVTLDTFAFVTGNFCSQYLTNRRFFATGREEKKPNPTTKVSLICMGSRSPLQNLVGDNSMDQVASLVFSISFSAPVFIQVLASFLYWLPLWSNTWQSTHCQPTQPRGNRPFLSLWRPSKNHYVVGLEAPKWVFSVNR